MNKNILGFIFIFISATSFGFMAIFGTFAHKNNLSVDVILLYRFLIAAILMNAYTLIKKKPYPRGKTLFLLIAMGGIGYAAQSFSFFTALTLIGSSLTSILLYLYPSIVLILSIFLLKIKSSKIDFIALFLATFGTFFVIGWKLENINFIGIMFGITAAIVYSFYIIIGSKALKNIDAFTASTVIISSSAVVYILYALTNGITIPSTVQQWQWIFAISIISTIVAIVTFFAGMKIIGPIKASMISTFEPIVTVLCSFWFLGESLGIYQVFGAILIIIAALLLS